MAGQSPRDFAEWMQKVERQSKNALRTSARARQDARDVAVEIVEGAVPGVPSAPVEIMASGSLYEATDGAWRGRIDVDFPDVTLTVDQKPINVSGYELYGYEEALYAKPEEAVWQQYGGSDTSTITRVDLPQGVWYVMKVRAIGGVWSSTFRVQTSKDTTPPPQPTKPTAEVKLGAITVEWDKKAVTGDMPSDFEGAVLCVDTEPSPGLDKAVTRFDMHEAIFVITGAEYYKPVYIRLIAVDTSGNLSPWSEQAVAMTTPLVDADIILGEIDAGKTRIINAGKIMLADGLALSDKLQTADTAIKNTKDALEGPGGLTERLTGAERRLSDVGALTIEAGVTLRQKLAAADAAIQSTGTEVATLKNVTLPNLSTSLTAAAGRLDAADKLLTDTFPKRFTAIEGTASNAESRAGAAEAAAAKAAADLVTAKQRADSAAAAATAAAADADAAEAASARATGAAGVAELAADKAAKDAAAALAQAQNAGGDIGVAQRAAAAAQAAADTAKAQAAAAGTSASAADAKAAQAAANAAKAAADALTSQQEATKSAAAAAAAKTSAGTAESAATAAQAKIVLAEAAATKAAADAATAKTRADTAAAAATTAAAEADAAEAASARATGSAGVAEAAADKAAKDAAAALTQAQNAGGNVSVAQAAAAAAQTAADTAKAQASAAGTSAAAADAKAAQAAANAAKAAADALAAQQEATKSAGAAATAKTEAAASAAAAAAAETSAATAKTRADTAAANATTAAAKATAAEASATKATGSAGVAETAADKAAKDAAAALTQAQNSGSNATAAQTAANAAKAASDTAATQAAAAGTAAAKADAAAAKAAADAAQAAADLIVARNAAADARGDADTALGRADDAVRAAGSAARVLYSTADPSGTARDGDTWRKTNGAAGDVIGEWRYTKVGTAAPSWNPQKVTSEMVSNLDVGKLTVGTAAIVTLVAERIAAATAEFQRVDAKNLFVTGTSSLSEVVAKRLAAETGTFITLGVDQLTVTATANLKEAVAAKLFANIFTANKISTQQMLVGNFSNMLENGSFEYGQAGWGTATKWSIDAAAAGRVNTGVMKVTGITERTFGPTSAMNIPVDPKDTYRLSGWVKTATEDVTATQAEICWYWYSANGTFIGNHNVTIRKTAAGWVYPAGGQPAPAAADGWIYMTGQHAPPATAAYLRVRTTATLVNAADEMLFDDLSVALASDASLLVDGSVTAKTITASEEMGAKLARFIKLEVSDLVATGTAKIGEAVITKLFTQTFATNKLTASQVLIGMPGNVLPDIGHNEPVMTAARNASSTMTVTLSSSNDLALASNATATTYFRPLGVAQNATAYKDWVPVQPGQVWRWGLKVIQMKAAGNIKFVGRTLDGQAYANPPGQTAVPAGTGAYSYEVEIPVGCYWILPEMALPAGTGSVWVERGSMFMTQVIDQALIVDGAITTKKLTVTEDMTVKLLKAHKVQAIEIDVNSLTSDTGWIGVLRGGILINDVVDTKHVKTNSITADQIQADAINAKHTLTGPLIRTAASGARTEMTNQGIRVVDAANVELLRIGYGISTGMSIRNPSSGTLTPLSSVVFGAATITFADKTVSLADSPTMVSTGRYTAVSTDVIVMASASGWVNTKFEDPLNVTTGKADIAVLFRRLDGAYSPTQSFGKDGHLQADTTWLGSLGSNATTTWQQYITGLVVGATYIVETRIAYIHEPKWLNVRAAGPTTAVTSVSLDSMANTTLTVNSQVTILPR